MGAPAGEGGPWEGTAGAVMGASTARGNQDGEETRMKLRGTNEIIWDRTLVPPSSFKMRHRFPGQRVHC